MNDLFSIYGWVLLGFFGQSMFFMRFVIQWIASERKKESIFPVAFWYFSIAGGAIVFIYALHIRDLVFIAGQGLALAIYIRNLFLIWKKNALQNKVIVSDAQI